MVEKEIVGQNFEELQRQVVWYVICMRVNELLTMAWHSQRPLHAIMPFSNFITFRVTFSAYRIFKLYCIIFVSFVFILAPIKYITLKFECVDDVLRNSCIVIDF